MRAGLLAIPDVHLRYLRVGVGERRGGVPIGVIVHIPVTAGQAPSWQVQQATYHSSTCLPSSSDQGNRLRLTGFFMSTHGLSGPVTRMPSLYIWSPPPSMTWNGFSAWMRRTSFHRAGPLNPFSSLPTEKPLQEWNYPIRVSPGWVSQSPFSSLPSSLLLSPPPLSSGQGTARSLCGWAGLVQLTIIRMVSFWAGTQKLREKCSPASEMW